MKAKAVSFTHRTKVFADGTVRKNGAYAGKLHVQFERRTVASAQARHLRPDSEEGW